MFDYNTLVTSLRDDIVNIIELAELEHDYNEVEDLIVEEILRLKTFARQYIDSCRNMA